MRGYRKRIWLREREVVQRDRSRVEWIRVPDAPQRPWRVEGTQKATPDREVRWPRLCSASLKGRCAASGATEFRATHVPAEEPTPTQKIVPKITFSRGFAMSINPKTTAAISDHP